MAEPPKVRAFLGLGSNLGDRWSHLRRAVDQLRAGSRVPVTAVSRVYETQPVGGPEDQGPFLNVVVELAVSPTADPYRLLEECRRLEAAAGRVRAARWGPRTLDADVLWIDGMALDDPELTVPHPRWRQRRFVLAPLRELAPDLVDEEALAVAGGEVAVVGTL
ncbi:MAG: 2-amino-4-hydroxy-6-hydroxymethyldihydropteridine diphosphokinase [Acidimicrobiales bacterium]